MCEGPRVALLLVEQVAMTDPYADVLRSDELAMARRLIALFDHPLKDQRHRALAQIVEMGESAVDALLEALQSHEPRHRQGALRALVQLASPAAIGGLRHYVEQHADELGDNRAFAMQALCAATSPHIEPYDPLFQFLTRIIDDRDDFVRAYAYAALGRLGDRRAMPLIQRGLKDRDAFVAQKASEALVRLESAPEVRAGEPPRRLSPEEIGFGLQSTEAPRREMALTELRLRVRDEQFDAMPMLTQLLHGPNFIGRRSALHALGALRDKRALPTLIRMARPGESEADLLANALRAIAQMGPLSEEESASLAGPLHELLLSLRHQVRHVDLFVRAGAVAALTVIPEEEAIDLLIVASGDEEIWIQEEASAALLRQAGRRLVPSAASIANVVRALLRRIHGSRKTEGRWPAGVAKQVTVLQRLLSALISSVPERPDPTFTAAIEPSAWEAVLGPAAEVRVKGLELLHELLTSQNRLKTPSRPALDGLIGALTSTDRNLLVAALELLQEVLPQKDASATARLVNILYRGDAELATRAIALLGRAGDMEARNVLRRLSRDDNPRIADAARAQLETLALQ